MTERPIFYKSQRRLVHAAVALCIVLATVLLTVGCIDRTTANIPTFIPTVTVNQMGIVFNTSVSDETPIRSPSNTHPEFIKMESDIYNTGEIIEFFVVNRSNDQNSCINSACSYRIAYLSDNGTWQLLSEPMEPLVYSVNGPQYRSSCQPVRIDTTKWTSGRYRIQYYCGISREFKIR
jgi:hypothetical protein